MILFVIVIVIAMLAVGSLTLLALLSTEYEATVLRGDEIQAVQLVQSGVEMIALTLDSPHDPSSLYENMPRFRGVVVVPDGIVRPARGAGCFTVFSPRIEREKLQGVRFGLVNESTRLHLGAVLQWEQESPGQGTRALLKLPGMTPAMADSILDWIDPDKTPRPSGAELEYYQRTGVPYGPRNAVPVTLEELLLVRDVTRTLLLGTDESFSYGAKLSDLQKVQAKIDEQNDLLFGNIDEPINSTENISGETSGVFSEAFSASDTAFDPTTADGSLPWCFLLTTLSAEKLVAPDGKARFFLNDSNLEFLEEQLKTNLDEDVVRFIMTWRQANGKIDDPIDLLDSIVKDKESSEELKSPFTLENTTGEEKYLALLDYATCESSIVVTGRVNLNEASRTVLEAVPELNGETVSQILNRRPNIATKNSDMNSDADADITSRNRFRHPVWLLREKIVDKDTMKKLSKRLTTGGDVYRAQIVGFYDRQGTVSRSEVVVDATVKPPRPIFSKDLTMFGSGFE